MTTGDELVDQDPVADARFDALCVLVEDLLRENGDWRDDERLIVFTEYKTTLDYIVRRLRGRYEDKRILTLFGGMDEVERDLIKNAFNDPAQAVRILLATDAAAEGLNLQRTARYMLHFDCPWNPSKLEQRNGRLDRHGQARDVTIHHFVSDQDQDLQFLAHVIRKADEIREDLGSVNELFDEAAHRRLVDGEDLDRVQRDLNRSIEAARGRAAVDADDTVSTDDTGGEAGVQDVDAIAAEIDLDPDAMRDTLEAAMAIRAGRPQLDCSDEERTCKVLNPGLPGWSEVVDDSLRKRIGKDTKGPVARLAFSVDPFIENVGGREVFSPRPDALLMHLSHPMLQKALSSLTRRRFPGTGDAVSRWTMRVGGVPDGAEALVLLRVRPGTLCRITEFSEHESNGRELDEGERVAVEVLPVLGQSAAAVEPGDGAFDHPTPGLDDEALHPIGSLDDLGLEIGQDAGQGAVKDRPLIGAVGEQFPEKGKQTEQGRQQRETAVAILNVGGGDDAVQQQALRIDQNMPLLALDQLAGIEAVAVDASPPFSALFTL